MTVNTMSVYVSIKDAQEMLSLCRKSVESLIRQGKLEAIRPTPRKILISKKSIMELK
ncbi:helix-turn-helix domain-containing protein [Gardnerella sp. DNF01199S]|uniref:helix-turn-helix domain-containing protein n=1 Tax=Gardnerella sp. DNF01199S TaxID=2749067 RepID=UPI003BAC6E19